MLSFCTHILMSQLLCFTSLKIVSNFFPTSAVKLGVSNFLNCSYHLSKIVEARLMPYQFVGTSLESMEYWKVDYQCIHYLQKHIFFKSLGCRLSDRDLSPFCPINFSCLAFPGPRLHQTYSLPLFSGSLLLRP